jgi:hypothetical protein
MPLAISSLRELQPQHNDCTDRDGTSEDPSHHANPITIVVMQQ